MTATRPATRRHAACASSPDDGSSQHLPNTSGTPLAEASFTPGGVTYGRSLFADINFNATQPMQAGQLYHLVIDNTDGSPAQNYISSNNAVTNDDNARPARWLAVSEWATLLGTRSPGSNAAFSLAGSGADALRGNRYVPVLQITTREGTTQGASPMESGAVDPDRIFTLASGHPIRERFTPSANHQINALSVATAAKAAGSLHWRILQATTSWPAATSMPPRPTIVPSIPTPPSKWPSPTGTT